MPRGKQLENFQVAQIQKFRSDGLSQRQIAEKIGCSQSVIRNVLHLGVNYNAKNHLRGRPSKLSEDDVQLARKLSTTEGKSIQEIRRELQPTVSYGTVYKAITSRKYGEFEFADKQKLRQPRGFSFQCFFCLSCDPEHFQSTKVTENSGSTCGSLGILLKYLLDTCSSKNEKILKDITNVLEENRRPIHTGQNHNPQEITTCDKCEEQAEQLAELHQELEKTQMKIVHGLKLFKRKILQHFVNGKSEEELCKLLESLVTGPVDLGGATEKGEQRRLLEIIAGFHMAVYDKGSRSVDVPCVILDKFAFNSYNKNNGAVANVGVEDFNGTVKTENVEDVNSDEFDGFPHLCNDDDINRSDSEFNVSLPSTSSSTPITPGEVVKLKKERLEPHVSCKPELKYKTDVDEPQKKRARRTASSVASCLISKTSQVTGEESDGRDPPIKKRSNRPKKYKKRIKKVAPKKRVSPKTRSSGKTVNRRKRNCQLCSFSNKNVYIFEHHLILSHETLLSNSSKANDQPAQYSCDQCAKSFFCKQLHTFHMEGHQGKNTIVCDACNERIPYPEIETHVRTHSDKIFACVNCSFCSTTRERYLAHLRYHGKGLLECDLCSKPYRSKAKLLEHLYEEHQVGQKHVCEVENCNKEFFNLDHLKIHKYVHTNPHECSQCGKVFGEASKLKVHQRMSHTDEKTFRCSECNESFRFLTALHSHNMLVHGAEKYKCEYCSKEYMSRGMLLSHVTTHEGTGIPCGICDKVLGSKISWRRHQRVHATEYSHICEECGKGFTSPYGLKRHSAVHGGEKKYKCQFCGTAFLYRRYLQDHERIHTGERPFTCEICGKGFTQRGSVSLHMKKTHPDHKKDSKEPVKILPVVVEATNLISTQLPSSNAPVPPVIPASGGAMI